MDTEALLRETRDTLIRIETQQKAQKEELDEVKKQGIENAKELSKINRLISNARGGLWLVIAAAGILGWALNVWTFWKGT